MLAPLCLGLYCAALLTAAAWDVARFEIPDALSLLLAAGFAALVLGGGAAALPGLTAGAAVLAAGFALFARGLIGGGDVKLMAATALWTGWTGLPGYLAATALAGGALALLLLALRRLLRRAAARGFGGELLSPAGGIPYGVALAAGGLLALPPPLAAALGPLGN
ncbi:MAG TPA: prepilin peptidase [Alphaproteobacteria bacterium]|nr:prepilin peptidase [Alphaproteobacteria bacterium]